MIFSPYVQHQIQDNDPIGDDWVKVTNNNLN